MTKQESIDVVHDDDFIDLGEVSELTEGPLGAEAEAGISQSVGG